MKFFLSFLTVVFVLLATPMAQAEQRPDSFADLADRLLPAVVNISTTQKVVETAEKKKRIPNDFFSQLPEGSPLNRLFEEFFQMPLPQQRFEKNEKENDETAKKHEYDRPNSLGSGFIIDAEKGYIVTNGHVLEGADGIQVILHDNTTLDAKLIGEDEKTDVALLQVETDLPLTAVPWGKSDDMRVGDWVLAIGNPFGLGGTVTAGIISARQRDINVGPYDDFLQTDASINRGNSGGPMFNLKGEVIGINTAIYSPSGGSVGIGFAIPSSMAKTVINQLIEYGRTRRGWVGVRIQHVTDEIAESFGLDKARGALVASVTKDGPAEKAGIQAGDIILSFNTSKIDQMKDLPRIVAETKIETEVPVRVWRDGQVKLLSITVGELEVAEEKGLLDVSKKEKKSENKDGEEVSIEGLGVTLSNLNEALRKRYNYDAGVKGVVITEVERGSEAFRKRLEAGAQIVEFNQKTIKSADDVKDLYEAAKKEGKKTVLLLLKQGSVTRFVALKVEQD